MIKITIEIDDKNELQKLVTLFNELRITTVHVSANEEVPLVIKGDKSINPNS